MGVLQDNIWNHIFQYAYPIAFTGAMFYGLLSIFQVEVTQIFTNKNWLVAFNTFIGLCGFLSFAAWFNIDISNADNVTQYIDLNSNQTRDKISTSGKSSDSSSSTIPSSI